MNNLRIKALKTPVLSEEIVLSFWDGTRSGTAEQCLKACCESHERLRMDLFGSDVQREGLINRIRVLEKSLCYAADCSSLEMVRDTIRGMDLEGKPGWRQELRDFAEDSEQHNISREEWEADRGNGITLYSFDGFFTAYYDDAAELWKQADDTLPMFHVMAQSDPPHRTVLHPMHLAAWLEHLAEICLPVQIFGKTE